MEEGIRDEPDRIRLQRQLSLSFFRFALFFVCLALAFSLELSLPS